MTMSTVVIPVRGLAGGKTRLSPVLNEGERSRVIAGMATHVLDAVMEHWTLSNVVVVSQDAALLRSLSQRHPAVTGLAQPALARALNAALDLGRRHAIAGGSDELIVLSGDLPLLASGDLDELLQMETQVVVATDLGRVGTNALVLRGREAIASFPFLFGALSFGSHVGAARQRGLAVSVAEIGGIQADLDTPEDWVRLNEATRRRLLAGETPREGRDAAALMTVPLLEHA